MVASYLQKRRKRKFAPEMNSESEIEMNSESEIESHPSSDSETSEFDIYIYGILNPCYKFFYNKSFLD